MSKFTTEVRFICESFIPLDLQGDYTDVDAALQAGYEHIFDFDFPIWKAEYKEHLCKAILLHYYTREIGFETYALWKLHLRARMNEIMPKYNVLYQQEEANTPFDNLKHTSVGNEASKGSSDGTSQASTDGTTNTTSSSDSWNLFQDTPQGALDGVKSNSYLTTATNNTDETTTNTTTHAETEGTTHSDDENTRDTTYTYTGKNSGDAYYSMMIDFNNRYQSVDRMVIDELNDLFFGLWE